MHIHVFASVLLLATCASSIPVTITGNPSPSTGTIIEASGTDVVAGNESNTDDPGKTIFVPDGSGATVIPTQEDPSVVLPGGVSVSVTGGSDGVVIIPNRSGSTN